jgi:hypothetical protein
MWVPYHHSTAHPQLAGGENSLQIWEVDVTANKGQCSSLWVGQGANNTSQ